MSRSIWILGAGLGVVGVGFVFAASQASDLRAQVRDLDRRLRSAEKTSAPRTAEGPDAAELSRRVEQVHDEVGKIIDRLNRMEKRSAPAATGKEGAEVALTGSSRTDGVSPGLLSILTPDNQQLLMEAVNLTLDQRREQERQRWREREKQQRLEWTGRRLGLTTAQGENVNPILQEYLVQYEELRGRRDSASGADRAAIEQQITDLRQATAEKVRPYLNADQLPKLESFVNPDDRRRGDRGGPPGGGPSSGGSGGNSGGPADNNGRGRR